MPTYCDRILSVLSDEPVSFEQIIERLGISKTKTTHVIGGIKRGINLGKIGMIQQPGVNTLYLGHIFFRR